MGGRTLREAIAVALEVVPSVELAAGDEQSRAALHGFLLGWIKEYAYTRGVIFEDHNLEHELREVIAELRGVAEMPFVVPTPEPVPVITVRCSICNAKPGERCTSLINANKWREAPHSARVALAQKGA